jgi:hypothetical protein
MTAQNLIQLATRLPLGTGETSADDRYVRSTTLAGYSDTTAMNSAIITAIASQTNTHVFFTLTPLLKPILPRYKWVIFFTILVDIPGLIR